MGFFHGRESKRAISLCFAAAAALDPFLMDPAAGASPSQSLVQGQQGGFGGDSSGCCLSRLQ